MSVIVEVRLCALYVEITSLKSTFAEVTQDFCFQRGSDLSLFLKVFEACNVVTKWSTPSPDIWLQSVLTY